MSELWVDSRNMIELSVEHMNELCVDSRNMIELSVEHMSELCVDSWNMSEISVDSMSELCKTDSLSQFIIDSLGEHLLWTSEFEPSLYSQRP